MKEHNRGILNLFCRTGKTILSCFICKDAEYNKILIMVPSLYLIHQTYNTWKKYYSSNYLLVSHEETYDLDNFTRKYDKYIIISTYNSSNKLIDYHFDICIFDEAHRTTGIKKHSYYQCLLDSNNISNRLFLTATTKEYSINDAYSMNDTNIYGDIIETISAKKALQLKRITPYKILTINISNHTIDKNFNVDSELLDIYNRYYKIALSLLNTMEKYNIKHVITYHSKIIYARLFQDIIKSFNNTNISFISGNHTKIERDKIINDFIIKDKSILCSSKVLQEGVDIPECDAVCFVDHKSSIIDTTQALSRCLTVTNNKRIAYIIIPFDGIEDVINDRNTNNLRIILRNMMEVDENLKEFISKYENYIKNEYSYEKNYIKILFERYNVTFDIKLFEHLRELAYEPYKVAKELIKNKYYSKKNYMENVTNDFNNRLPINPDKIYKSFGWINYNDYLSIETVLSNNKIQKIIWKHNRSSNNIIDSKEKYIIFAKENDLPISIEPEFENWIKFLLENYEDIKNKYYKIEELNELKIKSIDDYKNLSLVDNKIVPYNMLLDGFYNYKQEHFNINSIFDIFLFHEW